MSNKLEWEKFSPLFGSWSDRIKPFFETLEEPYRFLKSEAQKGKSIAPLSENVFKSFQITPIDKLVCCVVLICPYHTYLNKMPVSDGIPMSCSISRKLQPSLEKFYGALEREYEEESIRNPDLSYLGEQGIFLINMALTCEKDKPKSHNSTDKKDGIWEPFMKELFSNIIRPSLVPVITLGDEAHQCIQYLYPTQPTFRLYHPAYASYRDEDWDSKGTFKKVQNMIKQNNNIDINWIQPKAPF